jgi:hypothetical protein
MEQLQETLLGLSEQMVFLRLDLNLAGIAALLVLMAKKCISEVPTAFVSPGAQ